MFRSFVHPQGAFFVHGAKIKTDSAQQVKLSNNYKNTRLKLKNKICSLRIIVRSKPVGAFEVCE